MRAPALQVTLVLGLGYCRCMQHLTCVLGCGRLGRQGVFRNSSACSAAGAQVCWLACARKQMPETWGRGW